MSVPAGQANRYVYAGDGSSTSFAVNSVFETSADLLVYTWDTVGLTASLKVLGTDYTVSGGNDSTGTVVFASAPASTLQVVIVIAPTISQTQAITTGGVLPPAQYLYGLDFLTLIARRLNELFTRSVSKQDYDTSTFDPHLPLQLSAHPQCVLIIKADGTGFDIGPNVSTISDASTSAAAAAASAAAAAGSASAAATSATASGTSATASASSATASAASATSAAASAATAAGYAGGSWPYLAKTANYTALTTDQVIEGNPTGGNFAITLPTAVGNTGKIFVIKHAAGDVSGNVLNVSTTSAQTIDGAASYALTEPGQFVMLISDNANWKIISAG